MRKSIVALLAVAAALLIAFPVLAITYGEFDGNGHPNVGAMLYERNGVKRPMCSGTLIAPDVFLTAAHCTTYLEGMGIADVWVSFDPQFNNSTSRVIHGRMVSHPQYQARQDAPNDIAVIILDEPVTDVAPAKLPTLGLFDTMNEQNGLKDQTFTAVGYGIQEPITGAGGITHVFDGRRMVSVSSFSALNNNWIRALQTQATGDSGTCNGDSGGPNFLGDSDMLAGITIMGDMECFATNVMGRLDTPAAREFLAPFVTLP